jgi:hypothetical protein
MVPHFTAKWYNAGKRCEMGKYDKLSTRIKLASASEAHRESTRIPVHAKARIHTDDDVIEGDVENLSMNGAYVASNRHIDINSSVVIAIFDDSASKRTVFDIKARVIWNRGNGVGLQFA